MSSVDGRLDPRADDLPRLAAILVGAAILAVLAALCLGSISFSVWELFTSLRELSRGESESATFQTQLLWGLRAPRVALALLVGAGLALSGAALQGLFRNPLADPGLLGVSGGAALAAAAAIATAGGGVLSSVVGPFAGPFAVPFAAFSGALLATGAAWLLARPQSGDGASRLILAGVAINAIAFAGVGLITFLVDDAQLRGLAFWNLGGLGGATWQVVGVTALFVSAASVPLCSVASGLDALQLGEDGAFYAGTPAPRLRRVVVVAAALAVGASIAAAGAIGFIGLLVPHGLRTLGVSRHRVLLPLSALAGGALLVVADLVARTVATPREIPVGVLTALCGAPFFAFLLHRRGRLGGPK